MLVLKILGVVIALFILLVIIIGFNEHCQEKFGHRFFTTPMLVVLGVLGGVMMIGHSWYESSLETYSSGYELFKIIINNETSNGLVMMALSLFAYIGIAIYNFIKTNWIYGFFGTIIQFGLLSLIAYVGAVILIIGGILAFFGSTFSQSVYVVNK